MRRVSLRMLLSATLLGVSLFTSLLVAVTSVVLVRATLVDRATTQALDGVRQDLVAVGLALDPTTGMFGGHPLGRPLTEEQLESLVESLGLSEAGHLLVVQPAGPSHATASHLDVDVVPTALRDLVADHHLAYQRLRIDGAPVLLAGANVRLAGDLEVYRVIDLSGIEGDLRVIGRSAALAALVPVVLAMLLARSGTNRLLRPVQQARDAARRLAGGDLGTRLAVSGDDELAELAREFNLMAETLSATIDELHQLAEHDRQFVADAAHELRTPLTALTAAVDVIERDVEPHTADGREALTLVLAEVRGLRNLVENLLEISRFDANAVSLQTHEVDLGTVVRGAIARRNLMHVVRVVVAEELRLDLDPRRLDAVVGNLVLNAVAHGHPPVQVWAGLAGDRVVIDVGDAGPGIDPDLKGRVFERFAKGDPARSRVSGSGLGLAIARQNARLHGGDVVLFRTGPEGTTFRIELPGELIRVSGGERVEA